MFTCFSCRANESLPERSGADKRYEHERTYTYTHKWDRETGRQAGRQAGERTCRETYTLLQGRTSSFYHRHQPSSFKLRRFTYRNQPRVHPTLQHLTDANKVDPPHPPPLRSPSHKRFIVGCSSQIMQLAECLTMLRTWCFFFSAR